MSVKEQLKQTEIKIKSKTAELDALDTEIRELVDSADGEIAEKNIDRAKKKREHYSNLKAEIRNLESTRDLYKSVVTGNRVASDKSELNNSENRELRDVINQYLHSRGANRDSVPFEKTDKGNFVVLTRDDTSSPNPGKLTSPDAKPITPEDISYTPVRELQTIVDLGNYVLNKKVTAAAGRYPIVKNVTDRMHTVPELEKNKDMGKPDFTEVQWSVDTYREALEVSQEEIDDSAIDLMSLITENANQLKVNTRNYAISEKLKTFKSETVTSLDDLKRINNTALDPAYNRALIVSQSFYNWLDITKDRNGRYMLQDSIITPSGKTVLGMPIVVVSDTLLGSAGECKAFLGDVKRAIFYANRVDLMARWVDDPTYGQYLQAGMRFGVSVADKNAGYFLTVNQSSSPINARSDESGAKGKASK